MTWTLFGSDPYERLLDDTPVLSGSHPLHMYHGAMGSVALRAHGSPCCYDPCFQAGYPKTPVFDSSSRPGELFFLAAGGGYFPPAYKIGLAVVCCLAPLFLLIAARGIGLGLGASCIAVCLGLLVWWSTPGRNALGAGDIDMLLGGLAAIALTGLLVRFHHRPGPTGWLALLVIGWLGWFSQPALLILMQPLVLLYYLTVGSRHGFGWHVALLTALVAGLAGNAFWLGDWAVSWWIRHPIQFSTELLVHRTFRTVWFATLWGGNADRDFGLALIGLALVGVLCLNRTGQRPAARLLSCGGLGLLALAIAGLVWEPLGRIGTAQLVVPALWFAVLPAVYTVVCLVSRLGAWLGAPWRGSVAVVAALIVCGAAARDAIQPLAERYAQATPLAVGLSAEQRELIETLKEHTDGGARILWEDHQTNNRRQSRWTALLPILTGRFYIGGLDPDGLIEHSYASLVDGNLAAQPIGDKSDAELDDFCHRYNIGWVVCWSEAAKTRWASYKGVKTSQPLMVDGRSGVLFTLPPHSFVLKGQAQVLAADPRGIVLSDVVPDHGEVVLNLHYQAGMKASPARVVVTRELDPFDPIAFICLQVPAPVARVTLTWDGR